MTIMDYCNNNYGLFIINNYVIILIKTKMLNIHYINLNYVICNIFILY